MSHPFKGRCSLLIVGALTMVMAGTPFARAQNILSAQEWREDLDFLVKTIAAKHRCAFDMVSHEDFEKAAAALRGRLSSVRDHEIIVGMARLVAMLRDGHSRLTLPVDPGIDMLSQTPMPKARAGLEFRSLPLQFYLFSDGLHISSIVPELRDLLGVKVLKIGRLKVEEAVEAVRSVISYDSEMWIKHMAPEFLRIPEVLRACAVTDDSTLVPLEVEMNGERKTVKLEPLPRGAQPAWVTWSSFPGGTTPLYLWHRDKPFWFEYLKGPRLLYVQINSIRNDKDETLGAFAGRLRKFIDSLDIEKLVLDLRFNGGGNNYLNRGLVLALVGSEKVNHYGRLFTIIGRDTFSAAVSLVTALEQWTETIFVGEPTGNSPSQFGDSRRYQLPKSGLSVHLSSVYWRDWSVDEKRPSVAAGLKAEPSWDNYAAGRDPALQAILAYSAPLSLLDQLKERIRWGGLESAATLYYHYRNSPATGAIRTEETLIRLAEFLAAGERESDAQGIFRLCLSEYPDSFEALLGLGKSYVRAGDAKNAIESLKKALALKPGNVEAADWLKKAEALHSAKNSAGDEKHF